MCFHTRPLLANESQLTGSPQWHADARYMTTLLTRGLVASLQTLKHAPKGVSQWNYQQRRATGVSASTGQARAAPFSERSHANTSGAGAVAPLPTPLPYNGTQFQLPFRFLASLHSPYSPSGASTSSKGAQANGPCVNTNRASRTKQGKSPHQQG